MLIWPSLPSPILVSELSTARDSTEFTIRFQMANFAIMTKISYVTDGSAPNPLDFVRTKSMATQPQIPCPTLSSPSHRRKCRLVSCLQKSRCPSSRRSCRRTLIRIVRIERYRRCPRSNKGAGRIHSIGLQEVNGPRSFLGSRSRRRS